MNDRTGGQILGRLFVSELVGPMAGMLFAVLACSFLARRIEVAKLYHFDSDRDRVFRRRP